MTSLSSPFGTVELPLELLSWYEPQPEMFPPGVTASPATDTIRLAHAECDSGKRLLRVEATRTSSTATLQLLMTSTGQFYQNVVKGFAQKFSVELAQSRSELGCHDGPIKSASLMRRRVTLVVTR